MAKTLQSKRQLELRQKPKYKFFLAILQINTAFKATKRYILNYLRLKNLVTKSAKRLYQNLLIFCLTQNLVIKKFLKRFRKKKAKVVLKKAKKREFSSSIPAITIKITDKQKQNVKSKLRLAIRLQLNFLLEL